MEPSSVSYRALAGPPARRVFLGGAALLAGLLQLVLAAPVPADAGSDLADLVFTGLGRERGRIGADGIRRVPSLDRIAAKRASRIAGLPHEHRLRADESIGESLREEGYPRTSRGTIRLDLLRGYVNPAAGFVRRWRESPEAWREVLDPKLEEVGLAVRIAPDGWVVMVAVLFEKRGAPPDLRELERRTLTAVNEVRVGYGLPTLAHHEELSHVARLHSEDMARNGYISHRSPDGLNAIQRVRRQGVRFRKLAENIQMSLGMDDPVENAVASWRASPGHRKSMLDTEFVETGVGVAVDDEGALYFTQLFLKPDRPKRRKSRNGGK